MQSTTEELIITRNNRGIVKFYLFWVGIDVIASILLAIYANNLLSTYFRIRISMMCFALGYRALRYCYFLFSRLDLFRIEFIEEDFDDEYGEARRDYIERLFKTVVSIFEVTSLSMIQMLVFIYIRRVFIDTPVFEMIGCLTLAGALTSISKIYINKKYQL